MNPSRATSSQRGKQVLLAGVLGLLLAAVAFQVSYRFREQPELKARPRLTEVLAKTADGWTVSEEPLGQTEAATAAALKTLNLDDYVFRRYQRGAGWFAIYAAYWAPGRMPTRLVASHTPDRCWTENGMRCVDMRFRESFQLREKPLLPAEVRTFTTATGGEKIHVAYWHTVDGRSYDYGARFNAVPHPWLWWKDTWAQAAHGSREQLFVRVTSPWEIERLWQEPAFRAVMETIAAAGLFDSARRTTRAAYSVLRDNGSVD